MAAAGKLSAFCKILPGEVVIASLLPCVKELSTDGSQFVRTALAGVVMELGARPRAALQQPVLCSASRCGGARQTNPLNRCWRDLSDVCGAPPILRTPFASIVMELLAAPRSFAVLSEVVATHISEEWERVPGRTLGQLTAHQLWLPVAAAPYLGKSATIEYLLPVFLALLKDDYADVRLNMISKLEQVVPQTLRIASAHPYTLPLRAIA